MRVYTNKEVVQIIPELKPRTLIDWSEAKMFEPEQDADGIGSRRLYSFKNLVEIGVLRELISYRISRDMARTIMAALDERLSSDKDNYDFVIAVRQQPVSLDKGFGSVISVHIGSRSDFGKDAARLVFNEIRTVVDGVENVQRGLHIGSAIIVSVSDIHEFIVSRL